MRERLRARPRAHCDSRKGRAWMPGTRRGRERGPGRRERKSAKDCLSLRLLGALYRCQGPPRLRPVGAKRKRLFQLTARLGQIRGAAEEARELQMRFRVFGMLPDA